MAHSVQDFFRKGSKEAQSRTVFTNRVAEVERFGAALEAHRVWRAEIDSLDPDVGRCNVLNYHGIGGIGKSTLLRQLAATLDAREPSIPSAIIDFEDTTSHDMERVLLRIRNAAGQHGDRCVAFDVAFSFYWSVAHPGTTLESYTKSSNWLTRAGERIGLSSSMEGSVMDVAGSIVSASSLAHGATRLAHAVGKIVHDRTKVKHAIAECEPLPLFLDPATAIETLTYLPSLLAWDLQRAGNPDVVVFLDTYEELAARGRKLENLIQRIVYLLPNVLFVVAGRNRLDWDRPSLHGSLDYVGPHSWPQLVSTGVDADGCIVVGDLSDRDADSYLQERLVKQDQPAIPAAVRARIIEAAQGWPLYLEVAAAEYQQALQEDRLATTRFGEAFPALVARIAQDLSHDERKVLRAASLLAAVDSDLARAGAGSVHHAEVQRVLARGFVKHSPGKMWPYSLHAALRTALLETSEDDDFWGPQDWRAAAGRLLDELGSRVRPGADTIELARCLQEGLRLAETYALDAPWLSEAGYLLACAGALGSAQLPATTDSHAGALSRLLACITELHEIPYRSRPARLEACMSDRLSAFDRFWCRSLQASSWMSAGELEAAERSYRQMLDDPIDGDLGDEAFTMYALHFLKRGLFGDLLAYVDAEASRVNAHRIRGDVHRYNAQFRSAAKQYQAGLRAAERDCDVGLANLFRAELALVDGWQGTTDPARWDSAADTTRAPWDEVASLIGSALFVAPRDRATAERRLDRAGTLAGQFGFEEAVVDVLVARSFVSSIHGDDAETDRCAELVQRYVERTGTYASWRASIAYWDDAPAGDLDSTVQWLGGRDETRRRWRDLMLLRRSQVR